MGEERDVWGLYRVASACFGMQWFAQFLWCYGVRFDICVLVYGVGFDVECGHVVGGNKLLFGILKLE